MTRGMATRRIFLVGPMGVGKTTIGKILAKSLQIPFVDADKELEQRLGVTVTWVFDIEGESGFRQRERALLDDLTQIPEVLLATGGGAVLNADNRKRMRERGTVVYLSASADTLFRRTKYDKSRPLLQSGNRRKLLKQLLEQRDPLYRDVADIIVQSDRKSARQVVKTILQQLPSISPAVAANE